MRVSSAGLVAVAVLALAAPATAREPCTNCLLAGAAAVPLHVPAGTPLAGYGSLARRLTVPDLFGRYPHAFWFKPHTGELDTLAARALVIETSDARLLWVAVDLVAVDRAFTHRVARRLQLAGVAGGTLIISASHTHSGPGGFVDSALMAVVSVDREDPVVRDGLVDGIVEAIRRADATKVPARVGSASAAAAGLTTGRLGQAVDPEIVVVKIVGERGEPVAALWNYAIHGTMLGPSNLRLSGDVAGVAAREIERELGVPALFVNGAVGDVSPARHGLAEVQPTGRALAAAVMAAWSRAQPADGVSLALRTRRLGLPRPRLSLHNCAGRWIPRWLHLPLGSAFPADAELTAGALGDVAWVTIPGELQSALGEAIKRSPPGPWARTFVAGLSNDYLGYFLTPTDHTRVTYVACASLYGPVAGQRMAGAARELLEALGRREERAEIR